MSIQQMYRAVLAKSGDKVSFNSEIYESLIDDNAWSPAAYPAGWAAI